jgi:hypothetical protein
MKGYSALGEVFGKMEISIWQHASRLVEALPELWPAPPPTTVSEALLESMTGKQVLPRGQPPLLRCHELACAVAHRVGDDFRDATHNGSFVVVDGKYGPVGHSWIEWTTHPSGYRRILDVYAIGRLPMVQLIDAGGLLKAQGNLYVKGEKRDDFRAADVERLLAFWKEHYL